MPPLVVNPEGARHGQHAIKSSPPTKGGKLPRNKKDGGEEKPGWRRVGKGQAQACVNRRLKNRPTHAFASWHDWGLLASERSPFFPSLILNSYTHLRPRRMSGGHVFANAHGTVVTGGTFYAADNVSGTVRYLLRKLMAWISGRSSCTTAKGRRPMASFPLCQIQAIASQGVQKSSLNSRGIFPVEMARLRREGSSYCMVWGVLERPRFA